VVKILATLIIDVTAHSIGSLSDAPDAWALWRLAPWPVAALALYMPLGHAGVLRFFWSGLSAGDWQNTAMPGSWWVTGPLQLWSSTNIENPGACLDNCHSYTMMLAIRRLLGHLTGDG